jgi:hypothetical protein
MFTSLLVFSILGSATNPTAIAEAIRLESAALEHRRQLNSGVFEVEDSGTTQAGGKSVAYKNSVRIVLEGKFLRNDIHRESGFVVIRSRGPEYKVFYTDRTLPDGRKPSASVVENGMPARKGTKPPVASEEIDPRIVGMVPASFMTLCFLNLESTLGVANIKEVNSVSDDVVDGATCRRIERTNTRGDLVRVWIDPARGFAVLRCEIEVANTPVVSVFESRMKYGASQSGIWYPEVVDSTTSQGGKTIGEDHVTIRATNLNGAIDPSLFALSTMGISPGTDISYSGKRAPAPQVQWDGRAIVPVDPKLVQHGWGRAHIFTTLAVGFAAIASITLWLTLKPRPKLINSV